MTAPAEPEACPSSDAGFTLAEVLVAMGLFAVLSTLLLAVTFSTSDATDEVNRAAQLTGESRLALERMSRELRQARQIDTAAVGADSVAVTFWTDFDGDGLRDLGVDDPEVLTYRWSSSTGALTVTADDTNGSSVTQPVLAGRVVQVELSLLSSLWQYDGADGSPPDGSTSWVELDSAGAPVGNNNGLPDAPELEHVDLVAIRVVVADKGTTREFLMQADLRNQEQT